MDLSKLFKKEDKPEESEFTKNRNKKIMAKILTPTKEEIKKQEVGL